MKMRIGLSMIVCGMWLGVACGGEDTGGDIVLSDDDSAADDDTADDDVTDDPADDEEVPTREEQCYDTGIGCGCSTNLDCRQGLVCSDQSLCGDPNSTTSDGAVPGASSDDCIRAPGCRCDDRGYCNNGLECDHNLCLSFNEADPLDADDDASDDDSDDTDSDDDVSDDDDNPACGRSGVYDAAITIHTLDNSRIPAIEFNGCVKDTVARPQDCNDPWLERAEDINTRSVTWHLSVTRQTVVRGNGSLYKDTSDVSGGGLASGAAPNDWVCFGQSSRELRARVSVRVCDEVVYWLTVDDTFAYDTGCSFGVDFGNYIDP